MTTSELVRLAYDNGGVLYPASDLDDKPKLRHSGVPKAVMAALREKPVDEVADAVREQEQVLATAREWFFENLMPITGAMTGLKNLFQDYVCFAIKRGERVNERAAKQTLQPHISRSDPGIIEGFMLISDFLAICADQNAKLRDLPGRFKPGDFVCCEHYSHPDYRCLVILDVRGEDLAVKRPESTHVFWVRAADCEQAEDRPLKVSRRMFDKLSFHLGEERAAELVAVEVIQ